MNRESLLFSLILILLCGFVGGQIARKLGLPPLLGMMLTGIILGAEGTNWLDGKVFDLADDLRSLAVTIILMRAGLGLDREKLAQQGTVALRLGCLPALTEAIAIALFSTWLFQFDWLTGLLLGCVVGAESPAVIVPGMLRLKNLGWGVSKGIVDAILTGSALSDVLILLLFSLLLNFLASGGVDATELWLLPIVAILQIWLGLILGYFAAKSVSFWTTNCKISQNSVQDTLITASLALLLVVGASKLPYFSGYLGVMAMGFFLVEINPPLARRLRQEFNHLWLVAEIILFVLMGAAIKLAILTKILLPAIGLLSCGLLFGRSLGWYLATAGSNWTTKEKLFLLPSNSAKATVQAAIGAIPLSMGIPGGETILAIAALSILITAPLGAWAIPTFAPKLLTQDKVDPTKTNLVTPTIILGAIDVIPESAIAVLTKVAELVRRTNGEAIIIHVTSHLETDTTKLELLTAKLLLDIPHQFITTTGEIGTEILQVAEEYQATEIVVAKQNRHGWDHDYLGSVPYFLIENSHLPVMLLAL